MMDLERLQQEQNARQTASAAIRDTVAQLTDEASFVEIDAFVAGKGSLDGQPLYGEGVLCGTATMQGIPVMIIAQNVAVLYGSFGRAQAKKIVRALDFARRNTLPVVSVLDSKGARVGEGLGMLDGYAAVLAKAASLKGTCLHLAVLQGACVGAMAMYAGLADYRLAADAAQYSPVSVAVAVADGVKEAQLGAQAAAERGAVDFVYGDNAQAKNLLNSLLSWHSQATDAVADDPNRESDGIVDVPSCLAALCDNGAYIAYREQCSSTVTCALTTVNGRKVGVSAVCGEVLDAEGADKLRSFVQLLSTASRPWISLLDCRGLDDKDAVRLTTSLATLCHAVAASTAPKVAVIAGDAYGSIYTVLASKAMGFDYTLAFAGAHIGVMPPSGAIHVLYADELHLCGNTPEVRDKLSSLYTDKQCDVFAAAAGGYVDEVIDPATLRPYVCNALNLL